MPIILRDDDLAGLDAMAIALQAIEDAMLSKSRGALIAPPRHSVAFRPYGNLVFTIGGMIDDLPLAGFRVYGTFEGQANDQLVAVWSAKDGRLKGVIIGGRLGEIRTGAIGGIAIRHMSAPGAGTVGVVGAGRQARTQLEAAARVRDLRSARVYSRSERTRASFVDEMQRILAVPIQSVASARAAVDGADIVICATTSPSPVIEASWLKPGAHVNTVGPKTLSEHELGTDIGELADVIATDSPAQMRAYGAPFFLSGTPAGERVVDLVEIVNGNLPARSRGDETTLFCSTGLAGTEVLVASRVLERAGAG